MVHIFKNLKKNFFCEKWTDMGSNISSTAYKLCDPNRTVKLCEHQVYTEEGSTV